MQRTLLTERHDGTFQCTVTVRPDELFAFLQFVQPSEPPKEKPPVQTMDVRGFEAFAPMQQTSDGFNLRVLANHAPFQRFVESTVALPEEGDSVDHALTYLTSSQDVASLIERYREWHRERWPGETALPGDM